MFVDYITLMLVNMVAGLVILALYLASGFDRSDQKGYVPALAMVGLVAAITGSHMTLTWPVPQLEKVNLSWANIAYGEATLMFAALFLGAALTVAKGWSLKLVGVYALVAGATAIVIGARILSLGLTNLPWLSGLGFIVTGVAGVLFLPAVALPAGKPIRFLTALLLLVAAVIWAVTGFPAYWSHIGRFSG